MCIAQLQAKYVKHFQLDEAEFEVVCGGRSPSFVVSVAKKKPTAQLESDSDAENANGVSSDENDEDRAIREAKEADRRRKSEQKAEARKEKKIPKEACMSLTSVFCSLSRFSQSLLVVLQMLLSSVAFFRSSAFL